jgi:hypothetical protein
MQRKNKVGIQWNLELGAGIARTLFYAEQTRRSIRMHLRKLLFLALIVLALPLAVWAQTAGEPADGGVIEIGETVNGELTSSDPAVSYTFTGEEGTSVVITLLSEDFDCYLTLLDEDGAELSYDDDSAGNLDSRIGPFSLPADGEYTIVAQSYNYRNGSGSASGDFTLSLDTFEVEVIEYGETVNGALTSDTLSAVYSFTGAEGDSVIIRLSSDAFDSYLSLSGPDGFELITNDDSGGNLNSLIGPYTLPQTGDYTISAQSLSGSATGNYTLSLESAEISEIAYGDTVTVDFDDSHTVAYFTFQGNAGDVVNVTAEGDVDTNLTLNDNYNYQIGFDEDGGAGTNPELNAIVLTQAGAYTLLLQAPFGGEGSVELTLARGEVPSLNDGPQTVRFSSSQSTRTLVYTGEAGETVRLNVSVGGNTTGSPSVDVSQNGTSLTYVSASTVQSVSAIFTIPSDGDVIVTVSEYSYTNLSLEVSISSAE